MYPDVYEGVHTCTLTYTREYMCVPPRIRQGTIGYICVPTLSTYGEVDPFCINNRNEIRDDLQLSIFYSVS